MTTKLRRFFIAALFLASSPVVFAEQTTTIEAISNATVRPAGIRTGSSGTNFFNVEGDANGVNSNYGVVGFDASDFGLQSGSVLDIGTLTISLTESNAAFTAPGSLNFWLTTNNSFDMVSGGGNPPPNYDLNADPNGFIPATTPLGPLYLLGSGSFNTTGNVNSGQVDSYSFNLASLDAAAKTYLLNALNSGSEIRLVISPNDAAVAATWAGFSNSTYAGPQLQFDYTLGIVDVSIGSGFIFTPTSFGGSPFQPENRAVFDGAPGVVTLEGNVVAARLKFTVDGYELAGTPGNTISTPVVEVVAGVTAEISGQITGSNSLTKLDAGKLVLSNTANDFVGNVRVSGGTLEISDDGNLGDSSNDIVLDGGDLAAAGSVTLGADRTLTGSGGLFAESGHTLSIAGDVLANLILKGSGTYAFSGANTELTGLRFESAGTVQATALLTGNVTTAHAAGTARMEGLYIFSALRVFNIADGSSDVDLDIGAMLFGDGAGGRLHKLGEGTLRLSGDNSLLEGGVRIGTANGATGGRVIVTNATSLGTGVLQFNYGTLEAETNVDFANSISIGSVTGKSAVFQGANMSFSGSVSFFETSGQSNHITINNTTTLSGPMVYTGSFGGTGIVVSGSGTLKSSGDASAVTQQTTITDTATLVVDGTWGGAIAVGAGAKLKGVGTILGLIQMSGVHSVGNSAGIQTAAGGVSYLSGSAFEWELVGNSNAMAGVDFDQLIVSGGNISIDSNVTMDLIFNSVGSTVDWADSFWDADHAWTIVDNTGGGSLTGSFVLNAPSEWFDANGFLLSSVNPTGDFELITTAEGDVVLNYYAVPEPATLTLFGLAGAALWGRRRRA